MATSNNFLLNSSKEKQIKNSLTYLIPLAVSNALPLITLPVFTRILSKEEYGLFAVVNIYAMLVGGFVNFGMTIGFERNFFLYTNDKKKMGQLLYSSMLFSLCSFIFITLLTYFFRIPISKFVTGSADNGMMIICALFAYSLNTIALSFYLTYFKNAENARQFTKYQVSTTLLNFIISMILIAYFKVGVIGLIYSQILSATIILFILFRNFLYILPLSFNKSILKDSLKLSYPLTPRIFIGVIDTQFNKFMISKLDNIGGTGVYYIGMNISSLSFTFTTALQNVFNPQVYKMMFEESEESHKNIGKYLTPFLYISIFLALLMSCFSEEAILILTPKSYYDAIPIITILSMYYGSLFFGKITGTQLMYTKKTGITSLLSFLSIGLNVAVSIPFIIKFGAIGAAWATFLATLVTTFVSVKIAQHYYKIHYEYRKISIILLIFFSTSILLVCLMHYNYPYSFRLPVKIIGMGLFLLLGKKLHIITRENLLMLKNIFIKSKIKNY